MPVCGDILRPFRSPASSKLHCLELRAFHLRNPRPASPRAIPCVIPLPLLSAPYSAEPVQFSVMLALTAMAPAGWRTAAPCLLPAPRGVPARRILLRCTLSPLPRRSTGTAPRESTPRPLPVSQRRFRQDCWPVPLHMRPLPAEPQCHLRLLLRRICVTVPRCQVSGASNPFAHSHASRIFLCSIILSSGFCRLCFCLPSPSCPPCSVSRPYLTQPMRPPGADVTGRPARDGVQLGAPPSSSACQTPSETCDAGNAFSLAPNGTEDSVLQHRDLMSVRARKRGSCKVGNELFMSVRAKKRHFRKIAKSEVFISVCVRNAHFSHALPRVWEVKRPTGPDDLVLPKREVMSMHMHCGAHTEVRGGSCLRPPSRLRM